MSPTEIVCSAHLSISRQQRLILVGPRRGHRQLSGLSYPPPTPEELQNPGEIQALDQGESDKSTWGYPDEF